MENKKSFAYGWFMVVLATLAWSAMWVANMSLSIWLPPVCQAYLTGPNTFLYGNSIATGIAAFVMLFSQKYQGVVSNKWMMGLTALIGGIAWALIPNVGSAIVGVIAMAVSSCMAFLYAILGSFNLMANWFPRKRGPILGIVTAGTMLGGFYFNFLSAQIAANGVQRAMVVCAVPIMIYGVVCMIFIKDRPQDCGLLPDNMPVSQEEQAAMLATKEAVANNPWTFGKIVKCVPFWMTGLCWGLCVLPFVGLMSSASSAAQEAGLAPERVVFIVSLNAAFMCVGSVVSGFVDDKIGVKPASILFSVASGIGLVGMAVGIFTQSGPLFIVAYYFCSFANGAQNNFIGSMTMTQTNPLRFAKVYACIQFVTTFMKSFASTISGLCYSTTGSYGSAFVVFTVITAVGVIVMALNKVTLQDPEKY